VVLKTRKSSGSSSAFGARVRALSEIPALVIDHDRCYFLWGKRNFLESSNLYDAALAGKNLIEASPVLEFDGDHLIPDTCLPTSLQMIKTRPRNWI
jgi:hypothetical protein